MHLRKIQIQPGAEDSLTELLAFKIKAIYRRDSTDTTILIGEEYRTRNNSRQTISFVLVRFPDRTEIDLMGSGGKASILGIDWGSELAFIKRGTELISDFCKSKGLWCRIVPATKQG